MDNLQYLNKNNGTVGQVVCFKPYYKWITLNTEDILNQDTDPIIWF